MLAPDKVSVPVPSLVRETPPTPAAISPENVVLALLPPAVRVTAATPVLVAVPAPASEPTVQLNPLRSKVPPTDTVNALLAGTALAMPSFRVPALTVVAPVNVFAKGRVRVPVAVWVNPPVPEIAAALLVVLPAPSMVTTKPAVAIDAETVNVPAVEPIVLALASVIAPDQVLLLARLTSAPAPDVPAPFNVIDSAIVRPLPSTFRAAPVATVVMPATVPRAALLRATTRPAFNVVSPVYVLAAVSTRVPAPFLVRPPAPLTTAPRVSEDATSLTVKVSVAANDIPRLMVFAADTPVSVRFPVPNATELPERVYPLPRNVIELKLVPAAMSLVLLRRAAPAGNTRSSPATGARPPQFSGELQLLSAPAPVQTFESAATYGPTNGPPRPNGAAPEGSIASVDVSTIARARFSRPFPVWSAVPAASAARARRPTITPFEAFGSAAFSKAAAAATSAAEADVPVTDEYPPSASVVSIAVPGAPRNVSWP